MTIICTEKEFEKAKGVELLPLTCNFCLQQFYREKRFIKYQMKKHNCYEHYCNNTCRANAAKTAIAVVCGNCGKSITVRKREMTLSKSGKNFCSKSCAAVYNNAHKTKGTRKSKLEKWLEIELTKVYSNLEIHYNRKDTINSELDIYVPSLKLAFELNGIFHYEPIYGPEKLSQIQNNDNRKFQACLEKGIELVIIDTSSVAYCVPKNFMKFLEIIKNIINGKIIL